MAIKYQDENGNWVSEDQTAIETSILDIAGNFESENVEGALRELAEKTANAEVPAELEAQVKANTTNIKKIQQQIQNGTGGSGGASSDEVKKLPIRVDTLETDMSKAKDDIAYLLENGGGGGGSGGGASSTVLKIVDADNEGFRKYFTQDATEAKLRFTVSATPQMPDNGITLITYKIAGQSEVITNTDF